MRKLVLFLLLLISLQINAQIKFVKYSKEKLFSEAHKQKKYIFIDVYTDWCGPCLRMSRYVFTDSAVAALYNSKVLAYKANAEISGGIEWRVKYDVQYFPSYLFFNSDGILICKTGSGMNKELFIQETKRSLACDGSKAQYIQLAIDAEKIMNATHRKKKLLQAEQFLNQSLAQKKYIFNLYLAAKLAYMLNDEDETKEYALLCRPKIKKMITRFTHNKYSKKPVPDYLKKMDSEVEKWLNL